MTWTVTLISATKDNGNVVAVVDFVSPAGATERKTFRADALTMDKLRAMCGQHIRSVEARDSALGTLTLGPIDPIYPDPV